MFSNFKRIYLITAVYYTMCSSHFRYLEIRILIQKKGLDINNFKL